MTATPATAFDLEAAVLADLAVARTHWVPLAASLHTFHAEQAWKARGAETFKEWLAQPEVGIQYRTAKDMIDAFGELVATRQITASTLAMTDASKVAVVLPAIRAGKVTVDKALSDCIALTRADLRDLYRGGTDAPLDAESEPASCSCPTCGRVHRVKAVSS